MLKKFFIAALAVAPMLVSCNDKANSNCPEKLCTADFAMITIKAVNKKGEAIKLKKITSFNKSTNKPIETIDGSYANFDKGTYIAIDDKSTKLLSEKGDSILVTAVDSSGMQTQTAELTVSGGECACHVLKLSGPNEIKFDL